MRVLIVEDDRALAQLLQRSLAAQCTELAVAHTAKAALAAFCAQEPQLLILDLELNQESDLEPESQDGKALEPGGFPELPSGLHVLEAVRSAAPLCPVLVLSAAADAAMRVRCLQQGADDCLQKPFSLAELRARCGTLLRHRRQLDEALATQGMGSAEEATLLAAGELTLDRLRRAATLAGTFLPLTGRECTLLEQLMLARGAVVSREWVRGMFGPAHKGDANVVDVHVGALRRKLAAGGGPRIENVRGRGYRLALPDGYVAMPGQSDMEVELPWRPA